MALILTNPSAAPALPEYNKFTCVANSAKTGTYSAEDGIYLAWVNISSITYALNQDYTHGKSAGSNIRIFQVVNGSVQNIFYSEKSGDTDPYISISGTGGTISYSNNSTDSVTLLFKFAQS